VVVSSGIRLHIAAELLLLLLLLLRGQMRVRTMIVPRSRTRRWTHWCRSG
jgi:hypothetical protein